MKIHIIGFFLLSILISSLSWSQPVHINEPCTELGLPEPTGQNADKGFFSSHVFMRATHVCHDAKTLDECTAPDKLTSIPKLYMCFWSPVAQDYDVLFIITDISGTVLYLQAGTWTGVQGQRYWHGVLRHVNALGSLPVGDYKVFSFVAGKTTGQSALSDPYIFHKLSN